MRLQIATPVVGAFLSVVACGWDGGEVRAPMGSRPERDCRETAAALRIDPGVAQIDAGRGRLSEIRFVATATFADGAVEEVPASWAIDRPESGTMGADGTFVTSGAAGGEVTVRALARGRVAEARVAILTSHDVFADSLDPSVRDLFAGPLASDARDAPHLIAPEPETELPADPEVIEFRWEGTPHDYYRLRLISTGLDLSIYTTQTRFVPAHDVWELLATSNTGRRPVSVVVEAVNADGAALWRASTLPTIAFCNATELCNGIDDTCNVQIDEDCRTVAEGGYVSADLCR